jgi:hypothetical protein
LDFFDSENIIMTQPFQFANGQLAHNADDLLKLCEQFPSDAVNYLVREDLEKWLAYIGKTDIAQCATNARQDGSSDRQKLEIFLNKCHGLSPESTASTANNPLPANIVTDTTIPEKITLPSVVAAPENPQSTSTNVGHKTSSVEKKPSFFRVIAQLLINIFYRNKN